jgi:hypothetical protein
MRFRDLVRTHHDRACDVPECDGEEPDQRPARVWILVSEAVRCIRRQLYAWAHAGAARGGGVAVVSWGERRRDVRGWRCRRREPRSAMFGGGHIVRGYYNRFSDTERGIRFIVYPRARTANKRDVPAFKVKSVLRGTEYDCMAISLLLVLSAQCDMLVDCSVQARAGRLASGADRGAKANRCNHFWRHDNLRDRFERDRGEGSDFLQAECAADPSWRGQEAAQGNQAHVHRTR